MEQQSCATPPVASFSNETFVLAVYDNVTWTQAYQLAHLYRFGDLAGQLAVITTPEQTAAAINVSIDAVDTLWLGGVRGESSAGVMDAVWTSYPKRGVVFYTGNVNQGGRAVGTNYTPFSPGFPSLINGGVTFNRFTGNWCVALFVYVRFLVMNTHLEKIGKYCPRSTIGDFCLCLLKVTAILTLNPMKPVVLLVFANARRQLLCAPRGLYPCRSIST
jgi:hypothetical protein